MQRILGILFIFNFFLSSAFAQGLELFSVHLAYGAPDAIEDVGSHVYAIANGSLFAYDKADDALIAFTKQDGMSDSDIAFLRYDALTESLLLIYRNQNIDIYHAGVFYNLPDYKDKVMQVDKQIRSVSISKGMAYLATSFGAVSVNLAKREVADTYNLGIATDHFFEAHGLYCFSSEQGGFYTCPTTSNAYDFANWSNPFFFRVFQVESLSDSEVYAFARDNRLYRFSETGNFEWLPAPEGGLSLHKSGELLLYLAPQKLYVLQAGEENGRNLSYPFETPKAISAAKSGTYWATAAAGISEYKEVDAVLIAKKENLLPDSPEVKDPYTMRFAHGQLYMSTGGRFRSPQDVPGVVSILSDGAWQSITEADVQAALSLPYVELLDMAVSPVKPGHFYVSTFAHGLYEFYDNKAVRHYDETNSPLVEGVPNIMWTSALAFDDQANLWTLNSLVDKPLVVKRNATGEDYKPTTTPKWLSYGVNGLGRVEDLYPLLITRSGVKWFLSYLNHISLNVFDEHGNGENRAASKSIKTLTDQDGKTYSATYLRSLAEDLNGAIWLGTSTGPMIIPKPRSVNDFTGRVQRIKIARNDGTGLADYLLDGVTITAIQVDAANRKWVGTSGSGVYLLSDDGLETIAHFTTQNSPLPTDEVISLAYDEQTGRVFIGCINGLVVYQGDAKAGAADFSQVEVYPNPVRPEYQGPIHVSGLMDGTLVKITDVNNNLIYQGYSLGGHLSWDGLTAQGDRVKSGVYFIYGTSEEGKKGMLTKVMIVR